MGAPLKKIEFALVVGHETDHEQGLFSDDDLDVVKAHKARLRAEGDRREMVILKRTCTYPTDAKGNGLATGSTCETEVV